MLCSLHHTIPPQRLPKTTSAVFALIYIWQKHKPQPLTLLVKQKSLKSCICNFSADLLNRYAQAMVVGGDAACLASKTSKLLQMC
jgi:hypothetical protein